MKIKNPALAGFFDFIGECDTHQPRKIKGSIATS